MGLPSVIEAALLPGLIGWGKTREMLLTGALYSAAEALAMRFVQKVVPAAELDDAVEPLAGRHLPRQARGGPLAEGAHQPLGARLGGGGHLCRHRRPVRCLQDRRAAGRDRGVLRGQGQETLTPYRQRLCLTLCHASQFACPRNRATNSMNIPEGSAKYGKANGDDQA